MLENGSIECETVSRQNCCTNLSIRPLLMLVCRSVRASEPRLELFIIVHALLRAWYHTHKWRADSDTTATIRFSIRNSTASHWLIGYSTREEHERLNKCLWAFCGWNSMRTHLVDRERLELVQPVFDHLIQLLRSWWAKCSFAPNQYPIAWLSIWERMVLRTIFGDRVGLAMGKEVALAIQRLWESYHRLTAYENWPFEDEEPKVRPS